MLDFNDFVNESKVVVKRKYTEKHPSKIIYKNTKVRNKIFDSIKDGQLSEDEIINILNSINADKDWHRRNEHFFDVELIADKKQYKLSRLGKKLFEKIIKNENK